MSHPSAAASSIHIREATLVDGPLLAAIERHSPLVTPHSRIAIYRGDDYFAATRLMEAATVLLAELGGVPAGALCGAPHDVLLGGERRHLLYVHHARILPEFQRHGVGRRLAGRLREIHGASTDSFYWYIATDNATSQSFARRAANRWTFGPSMVQLDCARFAGPPLGHAATPADGTHIVDILNATHAGEEMFLPYTAASLAARLQRDPGQYVWDNLWLYGDAVVGVWPEGNSVAVHFTDASGNTITSRGAAVLDFGYLPGAEAHLLVLLAAWCGWLLGRGMSSLSVFTSPHTRHWDLLRPLGEAVLFDFWTPDLPQPQTAEENGVYVDHIYF